MLQPSQTLSSSPSVRATPSSWSQLSAVTGALLWVALPFFSTGGPTFASLEHGFLFVPWVASPLAFLLLENLLHTPSRCLTAARALQPFAATGVVASFFAEKGPSAAVLTAGWLVMALWVAIGGLPRAVKQTGDTLAKANLIAAHIFLPIGAVWLVMSRLGVGPSHFSTTAVMLATLHFHFSGFTLQLLVTATGRALTCPWLRAMHRVLSVGAVAGIPLIAAGNIASAPWVKFLGVGVMVAATVLLGLTTLALARRTHLSVPRVLLGASALSIVAAMLLAAVFGLGQWIQVQWISVSTMAATHGLLNAVGFTLCGLLAHLALSKHAAGATDKA